MIHQDGKRARHESSRRWCSAMNHWREGTTDDELVERRRNLPRNFKLVRVGIFGVAAVCFLVSSPGSQRLSSGWTVASAALEGHTANAGSSGDDIVPPRSDESLSPDESTMYQESSTEEFIDMRQRPGLLDNEYTHQNSYGSEEVEPMNDRVEGPRHDAGKAPAFGPLSSTVSNDSSRLEKPPGRSSQKSLLDNDSIGDNEKHNSYYYKKYSNNNTRFDWFAEASEDDDRTLLDIFGEVAKQYLTQRLVSSKTIGTYVRFSPLSTDSKVVGLSFPMKIPDTDEDCVWDWRSIRCEPACACSFQLLPWDYHLGRSCRRRPHSDDSCESTDGFRDRTIVHRVRSLVIQTTQILAEQAVQALRHSQRRIRRHHRNLCHHVWSLPQQFEEYQLLLDEQMALESATTSNGSFRHPPSNLARCFPREEMPPRSGPERLFCGPIRVPVCDEQEWHDPERNFDSIGRAAKVKRKFKRESSPAPHVTETRAKMRRRRTQQDVWVHSESVGLSSSGQRRSLPTATGPYGKDKASPMMAWVDL
jgi:hypothetical protein